MVCILGCGNRLQYVVAVATASALLGSFPQVSVGIFAHSSSRASWTGRPGLLQFIPKVFNGVEVSWVCVGQSRSYTPNSSNHVFVVLALCTGAYHYPKCLSTQQNQDFPSMDVRSLVQPLKNSHQTIPLHLTLQSAQCSQASDVHLSSAKPRLAIWLLNREVWLVTHHRTGFHCSRVHWWCVLHHSIWR